MLVAQPDTDARPEHVRRPDEPVPRWSSTTRSRVASAGAMFAAMRSTNGIAAWPGPPARPMTAVAVGFAGATRRLMLNVSVPAVAPDGSSGTAGVPHWAAAGGHGAHGIAALAAGAEASRATRTAGPASRVRARMGRARVPLVSGRPAPFERS